MITRIWAAVAVVPVVISVAFGAAYRLTHKPAEQPPPQVQSQPEPPELPLPELVAKLIEGGDPTCPGVGSLKYEACLLYQSALGVWRNVGFTRSCKPTAAEVGTPRQIRPEDAINAPKSSCFRSVYAVLVANTTPILSSTALHVFYLRGAPGFKQPGSDAEICIQVRHGICGNQAAVGLAFLELATIEARTVKYFYEYKGVRLSHINVEAMIDGKWRLIDTTYGAYWSEDTTGKAPFALAATDDIINDEKIRKNVSFNTALMPYSLYETFLNVDRFNYLSNKPDIVRGEAGTVGIDLTGNSGAENFNNIPNYVGDNVAGRPFTGLEYDLDPEEKTKPIDLTIEVSGASITGDKPAWVCVDAQCRRYNKDVKLVSFRTRAPDRLYIKTENDVAFVVMKSITWKVEQGS